MSIVILFIGIAILIAMITWLRVHAFVAFVLVAIITGMLLGVPFPKVIESVNNGIGSTLGSVVIIIAVGAMIGKQVALSGAAQRIAMLMKDIFGFRYVTLGTALTGFLVGIPLYYNVGFILLIPIIFSISYNYKLPAIYVGLPMLTALSVMHGYLPPHPSPMTLTKVFNADVAKTFTYGMAIAIPAILIAGPLFATRLRHIGPSGTDIGERFQEMDSEKLPGVFNSVTSSLLPVIVIGLGYLLPLFTQNPSVLKGAAILGEPVSAMLLAWVITTYTLGTRTGMSLKTILVNNTAAISEISGILLIIGSAGALKQILTDSNLNIEISSYLIKWSLPPLISAWAVTAGLRLCLGSATVAGITAAGILLPLASNPMVDPNLLVLAIGAGSLFGSHVNDTAFWLFKEYFGLSMKETFVSWTVMESIVSVVGLCGVLLLNYFI